MTRVILVRHGYSMANLESRFAGQRYNADLSQKGHEQAQKTADYIAENYKIDKIYSSDLSRAFQTAEHIAKRLGMDIIKEEGVREIYAGEWEGLKFDEIDEKYQKEYHIWKNDIGNAGCTDGETTAELSRRVIAALEKIATENHGKTVLVATHATPIRAAMCAWQGMELCDMKNIKWVSNASVTEAVYENGIFRLVRVGEDSHLDELKTALPKNV